MTLNELLARRVVLQDRLREIHDLAGPAGNENYGNRQLLAHLDVADGTAVVEKALAIMRELDDLADKILPLQQLRDSRTVADELGGYVSAEALIAGIVGRGADGIIHGTGAERRGIGDLIMESDEFTDFLEASSRTSGQVRPLDFGFSINGHGIRQVFNADFLTSAGWAPQELRLDRIAESPARMLQVIDIIPVIPLTDTNAIEYPEETTREHGAAEYAEGAAMGESRFQMTMRTEAARDIGEYVPVSDQQLEDVAGAQAYLNMRLSYGVRARMDGQFLNGDGAGSNLRGLLNKVGIGTRLKGEDSTLDALHKGITWIRTNGFVEPSHIVIHPNDWEAIRLDKSADGLYKMGSPYTSGPRTPWGIPAVITTAIAPGKSLVGSFMWAMAYDRQSVRIEVGWMNDQFRRRMRTIRATCRVALACFRPTAFCQVTL